MKNYKKERLTDSPCKVYCISCMGKLATELKQNKPFESLEDEVFINVIRTAERLNRKYAEFLKPYNLTAPQYNVLRILRGSEEEGLICREIGERMISYDPDVTKLLDRLEAAGFVTRERQAADRRVIVVKISVEGLQLLREIDRPLTDFVKNLFAHLNKQQLKTLNTLVESARENS